ncbi:NAD(P)-dependent oxidoreductase [Urechidicola croceus]|uniref:Alanine dehydrogenase n=1 Tax=Urechidicola croceus TaxID=1850246 RepID=A0A1D8PAY8_9FLAO|nr:NAD(P)-dependent oxidoreductase [Urechidicola croceus]AOW21743.1 alanine dehydrogenase [Urechidicola croceus]
MTKVKIGIIKERKNPPDRRVVFSPNACRELLEKYPDLEISVESSDIRVFSDNEYIKQGVKVVDDISNCDVLLGVKEVPIKDLIPNKKYFFFSHTIKKQPYNRKLLNAILEKNIQLFDHETLVDENGNRVVAFGRYAGIVGAYNGFRAFGLKYDLFQLPKAESLKNQKELIDELRKINLSNIKIVLTGKGRVSNGAKEMLDASYVKEVTVDEFLGKTFDVPVYVQLDVLDYNKRIDGKILSNRDFYNNPQDYKSNFMRFAKVADFYIAGHFYGEGSPFIFTRDDMKSRDFKIKVVADVSCDIDGPVACTIKPSTIANPIYGYNPETESEDDFKKEKIIAVMAVDNLPCELPNDASVGFGEQFAKHVIPSFFNNDKSRILQRSQMTDKGSLTPRYTYLKGYTEGLE